jgi:hypothetical protein
MTLLLVILILKKSNHELPPALIEIAHFLDNKKEERNHSFELARLNVASMVPCGSSVGMYTSSANCT